MQFRLILILIAITLAGMAGCQSTDIDDGPSKKFFSPDYTSPSLDLSKHSASKLGGRKSIMNSDKAWFDSGSKSLDVRFQSLDIGYESGEGDGANETDPGLKTDQKQND